MTIAHHWNSEEQTIPMRYGRAIEELICTSSALETGAHLAHLTSNSSRLTIGGDLTSIHTVGGLDLSIDLIIYR